MSERDERLRGIRDAHRSWHDARERCDYASMDSIEGKRYHMDVEWLLSEIERLQEALAFYADESKWGDDGPIGTRLDYGHIAQAALRGDVDERCGRYGSNCYRRAG